MKVMLQKKNLKSRLQRRLMKTLLQRKILTTRQCKPLKKKLYRKLSMISMKSSQMIATFKVLLLWWETQKQNLLILLGWKDLMLCAPKASSMDRSCFWAHNIFIMWVLDFLLWVIPTSQRPNNVSTTTGLFSPHSLQLLTQI